MGTKKLLGSGLIALAVPQHPPSFLFYRWLLSLGSFQRSYTHTHPNPRRAGTSYPGRKAKPALLRAPRDQKPGLQRVVGSWLTGTRRRAPSQGGLSPPAHKRALEIPPPGQAPHRKKDTFCLVKHQREKMAPSTGCKAPNRQGEGSLPITQTCEGEQLRGGRPGTNSICSLNTHTHTHTDQDPCTLPGAEDSPLPFPTTCRRISGHFMPLWTCFCVPAL